MTIAFTATVNTDYYCPICKDILDKPLETAWTLLLWKSFNRGFSKSSHCGMPSVQIGINRRSSQTTHKNDPAFHWENKGGMQEMQNAAQLWRCGLTCLLPTCSHPSSSWRITPSTSACTCCGSCCSGSARSCSANLAGFYIGIKTREGFCRSRKLGTLMASQNSESLQRWQVSSSQDRGQGNISNRYSKFKSGLHVKERNVLCE